MSNKAQQILLPKEWDKLLSKDSNTKLSEVNQVIYPRTVNAMYANLQYHNYHKLIKPLEKEGINTWPELVNEVDKVADKKSLLTKSNRDRVILFFGMIMEMAKLSDDQYEQLSQEEKDKIPPDEKYFNYGES